MASQKRWFKSKLIECYCGFGHVFLKITYQDWDGELFLPDDEQPGWEVEICSTDITARDRLRVAWDTIRGRDTCLRSLTIDSEDIRDLRDMSETWLKQLKN